MIMNVGPLGTMSDTLMPMASSGTRTFVPVKPSQFMYSQFQYVSGYPAPNGQEGVSIDKIKILNTLIDHLVNMKQQNIQPKVSEQGQISDKQIDTLINQYQKQIQTVAATAETLDYKPPMPKTGVIVDLVA